jgi:hypothetical protein
VIFIDEYVNSKLITEYVQVAAKAASLGEGVVMISNSSVRRHTVRATIPVFSLVIACGAAAQWGVPVEQTIAVTETVAIDTSNTNVGIADPYLYGMSAADIDKTLDEMQALGVQDVRIVIFWAGVEPKDDVYDWDQIDLIVNAAAERNMGVLAALNSTPGWATVPGTPAISGPPADPTKFADFAADVAARYAGKVGGYEVWNEPNSKTFWSTGPDPAAYTELLKAAYPAIKAADPDAVVIGAVTAPLVSFGNLTMDPVTFLRKMYEAGAHDNFDALSFHPYHYTLPFSQGGSNANAPLAQLEGMRELMVQYGDGAKLIWATEYGEPSSVAGNQGQAAFIADFLYAWSSQSYTGPSFVFTTRDTGSFWSDRTLGIFTQDGTPKAAAEFIEDWLDGIRPTEPPPVPKVGFVPRLALLIEQILGVVKAVVPFAAVPVEFVKDLLAPVFAAVTSVAGGQSVVAAAANREPVEVQTLSVTVDSEKDPEPAVTRRSATAQQVPDKQVQARDSVAETAAVDAQEATNEEAKAATDVKPQRPHTKAEGKGPRKRVTDGNKVTPQTRAETSAQESTVDADTTMPQATQDDTTKPPESSEGADDDVSGSA